MVPFTPATAGHFLAPESEWEGILSRHDELLSDHSSAHFLFTTADENTFLNRHGYLIRDSFQYHFINDDHSHFEHFLTKLKTKKAKTIRQERLFPDLRIERLTGPSLTPEHAREMNQFYLGTIREKGAIPYLTQKFFELLFLRLPENVLYVRAIRNDETIAGSLFYFDEKRIYGRYWGASEFVPNLHFELCYYQGIDFCLERKLEVFEAGAQGEHKIARGFRPVLTTSAHKISHPVFKRAVADFIAREKADVKRTMDELYEFLPFRSGREPN
jgi:predicted N-acyltransferase